MIFKRYLEINWKNADSVVMGWITPILYKPCIFLMNFVLYLILCAVIVYPSLVRSDESVIQSGIDAYENQDYHEAIKKIEGEIKRVVTCEEKSLQAAMEDPLSALDNLTKEKGETNCGSAVLWDAYFYLALSYLKIGDKPKAMEQIKEAKRVNAAKRPDTNKYPEEIVGMFGAMPLPNVEEVPKKALESPTGRSKPEIDQVAFDAGLSAYKDGNFQRAIDTLQSIIDSLPNCENAIYSDENCNEEVIWKARLYIALSYVEIDNMKVAIKLLTDNLKLKESEFLKTKNKDLIRGIEKYKEKRFNSAIEYLTGGLDKLSNSEKRTAYLYIGVSYYLLGYTDTADTAKKIFRRIGKSDLIGLPSTILALTDENRFGEVKENTDNKKQARELPKIENESSPFKVNYNNKLFAKLHVAYSSVSISLDNGTNNNQSATFKQKKWESPSSIIGLKGNANFSENFKIQYEYEWRLVGSYDTDLEETDYDFKPGDQAIGFKSNYGSLLIGKMKTAYRLSTYPISFVDDVWWDNRNIFNRSFQNWYGNTAQYSNAFGSHLRVRTTYTLGSNGDVPISEKTDGSILSGWIQFKQGNFTAMLSAQENSKYENTALNGKALLLGASYKSGSMNIRFQAEIMPNIEGQNWIVISELGSSRIYKFVLSYGEKATLTPKPTLLSAGARLKMKNGFIYGVFAFADSGGLNRFTGPVKASLAVLGLETNF